MSIVFIGTPAFAVPSLRRLASEGHSVAAVITQPDRPAGRGRRMKQSPVKEAALELGLPVLQPVTLRDENLLAEVASMKPEVMVAVAYGQILRPKFLEIAPKGVLNVHPSLLPKYRGASPIPGAILAGDDVTGVTIMLMDEGMDSGPILAQKEEAIRDDDTAGTLAERLGEVGATLLAETLPRWLSAKIAPEPQVEAAATVTRLLKKEDGRIDWERPAINICRQVRAYNPRPGAHATLNGALIHVWRALPLPGAGERPGAIVELTEEQLRQFPDDAGTAAFAIETGDGIVAPTEVQREGRKRLSGAEFLRGAPGLIGQRLQ